MPCSQLPRTEAASEGASAQRGDTVVRDGPRTHQDRAATTTDRATADVRQVSMLILIQLDAKWGNAKKKMSGSKIGVCPIMKACLERTIFVTLIS